MVLTRRLPAAGMAILEQADVRIQVVETDPEKIIDSDALTDAVLRADVLVSLLTEKITGDMMQRATSLRGIANMAVGFNNIDIAAANAIGIPVTNTPGVLTETTADLTWALLLSVARRIVEADAYMRGGRYRIWGPELMLGMDVGPGADGERKTLGIIGYGRIGRAVARRAAGFSMNVIAYNPGRVRVDPDGTRYVALDDLLRCSDFVSIHAPSSPATFHLIDETALAAMKPTSYLINVGRGEVVDENALVRALQNKVIAGAALDVFEQEPAMAQGLRECSNAVIVPHIGSASRGTRDTMATLVARNALAHLSFARAPNVVNPEVYDQRAYVERRSRLE